MRLRCGDRVLEARPRLEGDAWRASVGDLSLEFSLERLSDGVFLVREGGVARTLHLAREGDRVHVFWDGRVYTLTEEREGARPAQRADGSALEAPMPGRVSVVRAAPGQRVAKGEELLVVEAMKMENALRAPRGGVVRAVHVSVGDMVAPGRPLVEIGE